MAEKPDPLPTEPDAPKRPDKAHKPGTGEGEYPVHPDRPNLPDEPKPDNTLPEPPRREPKG